MATYKDFKHRNAEYDAAMIRTHRAFYDGGPSLLGDKAVMADNFFRGPREEDGIYAVRSKRAFYENTCGKIVDYAAAGLEADPLHVEPEDGSEADEYYEALERDVSPPGGRRCSLNELKHEVVLDALLHRRAWVRVDMPAEPEQPALTLADQEKSGALDAYMVCMPPECVVDWELDDSGELLFALTREIEARRRALEDKRNQVTERFVWYTATGWAKYEFDYDIDKKPSGPGDDEPPTRVTSGPHSFGRVPIRPFEIPHGLWMMSKLFPLAREHFNLRNSLSYAEMRCLFAQRVAYLADKNKLDGGTPANGKARDPDRAKNQTYGQGRVLQMREGDKLEWDAPPVDSFEYALDACSQLVEAMHGVTHQMALAVKNTPSALKRSADSKAEDKSSTAVVLRALGGYLRVYFVELFELVSRGRGDDIQWTAKGAAKFDDASFSDMLVDASTWVLVPGHAPTANRLFMMALYRAKFGETASEEDYDTMDAELEASMAVDHEATQAEAGARGAIADETAKQAGEIVKPKPAAKPPGKAKK